MWILKLLALLTIHAKSCAEAADSKPSIILVVADDVGWSDVSFTSDLHPKRTAAIHTPNIDALARRGTIMAQHYTQSTCTPARASLLTGRYAANTGLTLAMLPGSVAGLPAGMMTLPRLLRDRAGYRAHQVGKHHVGHAQWRQTPVGLGFEVTLTLTLTLMYLV